MEQETLRDRIIRHLGQFPTRVPLAMQVEQIHEEEDYKRTLLSYMVEPGERVTAWLLSPRDPAPAEGWPGIVAIHQHGGQYDQGKSEPAGLTGKEMHHLGPDLSRRGYAVLCPDQLCFGDRRPAEEVQQAHNGMLVKKGYEQFEFTRRILWGSCLQTKYLHDLTCALDLLTELPQVNAKRLGAIGHSLGGQETLWLTWYDARVTVGVSSCGFGSIPTILRDGINHNLALYVPGLLQTCDLDALLVDIAPRPFLLTAGEEDPIFPIDGVRTIVTKAQKAYAQKGASEHFRPIIFPGKHSFPDDIKAEAYAFLDKWLKD